MISATCLIGRWYGFGQRDNTPHNSEMDLAKIFHWMREGNYHWKCTQITNLEFRAWPTTLESGFITKQGRQLPTSAHSSLATATSDWATLRIRRWVRLWNRTQTWSSTPPTSRKPRARRSAPNAWRSPSSSRLPHRTCTPTAGRSGWTSSATGLSCAPSCGPTSGTSASSASSSSTSRLKSNPATSWSPPASWTPPPPTWTECSSAWAPRTKCASSLSGTNPKQTSCSTNPTSRSPCAPTHSPNSKIVPNSLQSVVGLNRINWFQPTMKGWVLMTIVTTSILNLKHRTLATIIKLSWLKI